MRLRNRRHRGGAAGIAPATVSWERIAHNVVMLCRLGMRRKCVGRTRRSVNWSLAGIISLRMSGSRSWRSLGPHGDAAIKSQPRIGHLANPRKCRA